MKFLTNTFLEYNSIDIVLILLSFLTFYYFNLLEIICFNDKYAIYYSLIGFSVSILSFGSLSATILISNYKDELFEKMIQELGASILKKVFRCLQFIFLAIIILFVLNIKFKSSYPYFELFLFLVSIVFIFSNTLRFILLLHKILKLQLN